MIDFSRALPQATLLMTFGGGLLAFLSPCVLPMLPVYALYLLGENSSEAEGKAAWGLVLRRCLGLAASFTILFTLMGAGAGMIGSALKQADRGLLDTVCGVLMILFGIWMLGLLRLPGLRLGKSGGGAPKKLTGFWTSFAFGLLLVLAWTPCMTPMLANALVLAASAENATMLTGMAHLFFFALGLCLPMLAFMLLYQWLKGALLWLKTHQMLLRRIGGGLMVAYGVYLFF